MRRRLVFIFTTVILAGIPGAAVATAATPEAATTEAVTPEKEAAAIGEKWLALLDDQKYEESWNKAGNTFRSEVKLEQWVVALKRSREPMGAMLSRTTARVDLTKTLRGAPDGDYAIIHYTTGLKEKTITERLTLVKEDGKWEVSAYAIH